MPSIHATNAAAAAANHRLWFGDPDGISYRAGPNCSWVVIAGAVAHGETIGWQRRGTNPQYLVKVIRRSVFVDRDALPEGLKLNAHIRIGGDCGAEYTVQEMTTRVDRVELHLQRGDVGEITRPGYRGPVGG